MPLEFYKRPIKGITIEDDQELAPMPTTISGDRRDLGRSGGRRGAWWFAICLLVAGVLVGKSLWGTNAEPIGEIKPPPASQSIESIRVGQRVVATNPRPGELKKSSPTAVDPATWRKLRLHAETSWSDAALDVIEVETLQSPEWVEQHAAQPGATVPFPLDLAEMGLPEDLLAVVVSNEPCPPIADGPGRVVLTTINHLNANVIELSLTDAAGHRETVRPTGPHKFYSETRADWVSAQDLRLGEQVQGVNGLVLVTGLKPVAGEHRVYNFTVEGEHCYRVSGLGVLVHNNCHNEAELAELKRLHDRLKEAKEFKDEAEWLRKNAVDQGEFLEADQLGEKIEEQEAAIKILKDAFETFRDIIEVPDGFFGFD